MENDIQNRYWRELDQLKIHVFYLENYYKKTLNYDRNINVFLAVVSNGSIASWAIWKDYSAIWGGMIALSQLLNAVKVFLPYSKRLKDLEFISRELENLFLFMESSWFDVAEGKLTKKEIHKQLTDIKKKKQQIMEKNNSNFLPHNEKLMDEAIEKAKFYFTNFYSNEE
jgi:hypothetical protein